MRKYLTAGIVSVVAANAAVLTLAAVSLVFAAKKNPETAGRKTALFNSVFFEREIKDDGSADYKTGTNNPLPLAVIWTLAAGLMFALQVCLPERRGAEDAAE